MCFITIYHKGFGSFVQVFGVVCDVFPNKRSDVEITVVVALAFVQNRWYSGLLARL